MAPPHVLRKIQGCSPNSSTLKAWKMMCCTISCLSLYVVPTQESKGVKPDGTLPEEEEHTKLSDGITINIDIHFQTYQLIMS